ncbi:hypothetical protein [Novosphingobium sp. FSW06-99]|uniref:hypothetical protein n=1 Tax=Novosphingobium sp. FSW06-99 TaxID=1739113 RepID=UPI00076D3268|nr:hypothetical protein [Novosphingobium sp. FSW06-99]KUR80796.1 hypothetical protein AQZ49_01845 [Novosphingobium sp. FSW06-99]
MKGADQCPSCGSRRWLSPAEHGLTPPDDFYSADVRCCVNCQTIWEPFDPAEMLDPAREPLGAFRHPCNNCAFRKGSPEQCDPESFAKLRAQLGWHGASFYCHKGVPVDPASEDGFRYPKDASGNPIRRKLRLCRGYLNQLGSFPLDRALPGASAIPDEPWIDPISEVHA